MRRIPVTNSEEMERRVYRVVAYEDLHTEWQEHLHFAVLAESGKAKLGVQRLQQSGLTNIAWIDSPDLESGDIIVPHEQKSQVTVVYRESDVHHSLFMTNRCNSNCLMRSQPPTKHDDSWLIAEALEIIAHIRVSPSALGLTGGEPVLLGGALRTIIDAIQTLHPATHIEILTNGRLLKDTDLVKNLTINLTSTVSWLVPLYGHADFIHDFVVQSPGAFEETIAGLLNLQEYQQPIQLRIVLIDPVLRVLPELCQFIGQNLPFVNVVALMACEPIGYALANQDQCEVDLVEWGDQLLSSARTLQRHAVPFLLMNAPLCSIPSQLWQHARRSISDWKNVYAEECRDCHVKAQCSGLFAWHERGWKPTRIKAIEETLL
ncbi:MAG: His-Xaa-Ser system radical SAM maturase HxsC [Undibacterium umbellatum]|uniref:His-Xaa-Ser system radical SAM maturase HxsC n=1 Tax=Undibacterium umbellatum TaxID=2762300 RepID=UPI003BB4AF14